MRCRLGVQGGLSQGPGWANWRRLTTCRRSPYPARSLLHLFLPAHQAGLEQPLRISLWAEKPVVAAQWGGPCLRARALTTADLSPSSSSAFPAAHLTFLQFTFPSPPRGYPCCCCPFPGTGPPFLPRPPHSFLAHLASPRCSEHVTQVWCCGHHAGWVCPCSGTSSSFPVTKWCCALISWCHKHVYSMK